MKFREIFRFEFAYQARREICLICEEIQFKPPEQQHASFPERRDDIFYGNPCNN